MASLVVLPAGTVAAQTTPTPPPAAQNPSPMVETSRTHQRITPRALAGRYRSFQGPLNKSVSVYIPQKTRASSPINVIMHFHGDSSIANIAVDELGKNSVAVSMTLGAGSGVYDRTYSNAAEYDSLMASVRRALETEFAKPVTIGNVTLSGFSAGHGAIRAILRSPAHFADIDAVLLLDGMHTSYVPEGIAVANGGVLDSTNLMALTAFARAAMRGEKRFLVTHSEIFPGTFASTTETADYIIRALGLKRTPVLRWGPMGMQQLSRVKAGHFEIQGYAGNAGPDHIDQFHAMPQLLRALLK
ncbi:MAG: hypothetical protein ACO1Q7_11015 [Gemmatimonas sp.]